MSTLGHRGSGPTIVPMSEAPPLCRSVLGHHRVVPPSDSVDVEDELSGEFQEAIFSV
jgi:hypothetical protein